MSSGINPLLEVRGDDRNPTHHFKALPIFAPEPLTTFAHDMQTGRPAPISIGLMPFLCM